MTHTMVRSECDIVSGLDYLTGGESNSILLSDLFDECLRVLHGSRLLSLEDGGAGSIFKLRVKGISSSRTRRCVGAVL